MGHVDEARDTLDWAVRNEVVFMVLFVGMLSFAIYFVYMMLERSNEERREYKQEIQKEREDAKQERNEFLLTLKQLQDLTQQQHNALVNEIDRVNRSVTSVGTKVDLILIGNKK